MMFVCLLLHEISDFGGGEYGGRRLSGCNIDQRNVTPLSSGQDLHLHKFLFQPSLSCYKGLKYLKH